MNRTRGRETVRVTKVMGHAKDVDVQQCRVRLVDQQGNAEADAAADLGRRHPSEALIDARRKLLQARCHWYPIMTDLHRFMIAVAWVSVNHDGKGGTAPDPLVWDQGSRPKVRKLAIRVNVDLASPGPPGFLNNSWIQVDAGRISGVGWNQCSHGLSSRPLESCHHQCLKAVCDVLVYPKGEMTSGWIPNSALYLVRQWIHISVSLRRLVVFTHFCVKVDLGSFS